MTACWAQRGCDEEMQARCPHNTTGESCPAECHFAACERSTHKVVSNPLDLLNPDIDFNAAVKEGCHMCEFFLQNAPAPDPNASVERQGNPNRFLL